MAGPRVRNRGTLPSAFRHPDRGYVDVYVMYRSLREK
jgi:hypothetical protein